MGDIGTTTFSLIVNSANFSGSIAPLTYTFDVVIACSVVQLNFASQASSLTYTLNDPAASTVAYTGQQLNDDCQLPFTYSVTYAHTMPFVTHDPAARTFYIQTAAVADVGLHSITVAVEIP